MANAFGNALGNAAIAGIEHENAISEQKQQTQPTSSLLAADNPNSTVNPVAAFLSGPYANDFNGDGVLANYNPFNGQLLASADGYSTYTGVYGLPSYGLNNGGPSVVAGQSDTEIVEIDGKKYRATFTVGDPESLDANSEGGAGMPGQTGDITDSMSPLQMQVMDTDPNSPQYADLQRQLYTQQWMQAFNNNDPGTMGLIETEESLAGAQQAMRNHISTDGFMSAAPDPNVQLAFQNNLAAAAGGPFVALAIGAARYFGASEQGVQNTGELAFGVEMGAASVDVETETPMVKVTGDAFEAGPGSLEQMRAYYAAQDPSYDYNPDTFTALGVDSATAADYLNTLQGQSLLQALGAARPDATDAEIYDLGFGMVQSGVDLPNIRITNSPLLKLVPEGEDPSNTTGYWMTLEAYVGKPEDMTWADYAALPLGREAPTYSVFQMTPLQPAAIFESNVARAVDLNGLIQRQGGLPQALAPNRLLWSKPVQTGTTSN